MAGKTAPNLFDIVILVARPDVRLLVADKARAHIVWRDVSGALSTWCSNCMMP